MRNTSNQKNNTSGVKGITWSKAEKKWESKIAVNCKQIMLGRYKSFIDSVKARWEAEKKYNFPNCNSSSSAFLFLRDNGAL